MNARKPRWRRWTGIEPAVVGSPRPPALKAGEPTRYPDTSEAEVSWSVRVNSHDALVENALAAKRSAKSPRASTTDRDTRRHCVAANVRLPAERRLEVESRRAAEDAIVRHQRHRQVNRGGSDPAIGIVLRLRERVSLRARMTPAARRMWPARPVRAIQPRLGVRGLSPGRGEWAPSLGAEIRIRARPGSERRSGTGDLRAPAGTGRQAGEWFAVGRR